MLLVTVLLTEKLAAGLKSAASTNPTPSEYHLSLKGEVHKINTHTNEDRKQNYNRAISPVYKQKFKHSECRIDPYQTGLCFEGGHFRTSFNVFTHN